MNSTDALITAASAWITEAAKKLQGERLTVLQVALEAPGADVRLLVALREGALILEATNAGKRLELYREGVASLQPVDPFGHD